jgi:DNA-binding MarR family transcriptional regulator
MGQEGASVPFALALFALRQVGRPMPMPHLSRMLVEEPQSLTSLADRLQRAGLVQRIPGRRDRRTINLLLTPDGMKLAEQLAVSANQTL